VKDHLELKELVLEHCNISKEMVWGKVYDVYRLLNDLSDLTVNSGDIEPIARYLENVRLAEPDYRQFISAKNSDIDVVLQRYMLESATLNIIVDFDIDPLEQISAETAITIIKALEDFFAKILSFRSGSHVYFHIKNKEDFVHIYADYVAERIFEEELKRT